MTQYLVWDRGYLYTFTIGIGCFAECLKHSVKPKKHSAKWVLGRAQAAARGGGGARGRARAGES
jgi:hypothetical protein